MKARKLRSALPTFVLLAAMLMLTGCSTAKPYGPAYGQASQPHYLYLQANQSYVPVTAEKWVSPKVLEEKDQTILELTRALERVGVQPYLPPAPPR